MDTKDRIERAAETLIRKNGVSGLTMRGLAAEASVALKTPYNLYGSKTAVLIALLNQATSALMTALAADESSFSLGKLFSALDCLEEFYGADETYYRSIFWAVMTSDHPEERSAAHANIVELVTLMVNEALSARELKQQANAKDLGEQLGLNLLANMGSWAGGHLSIKDTVKHTKSVWLALLLPYASKKSVAGLKAIQLS